ncbi:MAG: excinuclease ABC subunit UvrA [Candidatus Magasanikbacteria bacterium]|nr:excinuclease ABC subunit UvrA [Candidatus Magasanikbacteria bacterium]
MRNAISISHCRVNNLKDISLSIPKNKLTVITGLSGSGKSSLAFDTIYAEGQRRYAESLNAYARQFMDVQDKPDVDEITGLSPTIAIDQKNVSRNPRSTVGTTTEIYDFLRLLFARAGVQYCPESKEPVTRHSVGEITEHVRTLGREHGDLLIVSPLPPQTDVNAKQLTKRFGNIQHEMIRINGVAMHVRELKKFSFTKTNTYAIDIVVGRITDVKKQPVGAMVEEAIDLSNGCVTVVCENTGDEQTYTTFPFCASSGQTFDPIEPRTFSFNSPYGACPRCTGLGYTLDVDTELVIPNPRLTLAEGAIQPWTRIVGNQQQYQKLLEAVAAAHDFSVDISVKDLPQRVMDILLYGTDGQVYAVGNKKLHFDGIVPNLTQRHAETTSEYIRKEIEQYMREKICPVCEGKRLKRTSLSVFIGEHAIADVVDMTIEEAYNLFHEVNEKKGLLYKTLGAKNRKIALPIIQEVTKRLQNLMDVGLYYLTLNRSMNTLSGGEGQRIRLSTQLSTGLTDVIYILDEPSIGLHPKDNDKLIATLQRLRDLGNTVIVVEHDADTMQAADHIIDIGPGAGHDGGHVVAEGTFAQIKKNKSSITGEYLTKKRVITPPKKYRKGNGKHITIVGATEHNLKNIDVSLPLGTFMCVTGVSGSGKSTLISSILSRALSKHFYRAKAEPGAHKKITGISHIDKIISVNQSPIGRTPRSNPATYTGVFTAIRDLFTTVPEAQMRGYGAGMFSFNVKGGGRCEACSGEGYTRIPMQFLTDVFVECGECHGKRYNKEALDIHYRQKNIAEVLSMTIEEAYQFFRHIPAIGDKLNILRDVGLGYLHLGQPATTLSGGEAQRIKLATELSRRSTGKTLYILDEPTTGLHFEDIKRLLQVLQRLVDKGNTVLTIEHNLDVIKSADWVIDLGPEGGKRGGDIVAEGTPKDILKVKSSLTGKYLKTAL